MGTLPSQRSFADVLQDIVANIQQIIRSEFRLARAELTEKANRAAKPATTLAAGAILGLYGLGFLLLAIVHALSIVLATWLAALLVSALLIIVSATLVVSGRKKLKQTTRSRKNCGNREGECAMGQRPDEIEQQIYETRENLNENFNELQEKVRSAFDWRTQFDERPMTMLAVAFGGGLLASALIPSRGPRRGHAYRDQLVSDESAVNRRRTEPAAVGSSSRATGDIRRSDGYDD